MNMTLHNVDNPRIQYNNSLSEDYTEKDKYSLILANPPFSGSLESETVSKSLCQISGGTKKSELLFLSLFLRLLKVGGRCVSIVPIGVMNNTNDKAYNSLRKELVENQKLSRPSSLCHLVFSNLIPACRLEFLFLQKQTVAELTKSGCITWKADGYSLDLRRNETSQNDIPDIKERFNHLNAEQKRLRTDKSFLVDKQEIAENGYVFSFSIYQKKVLEKKTYRPSNEIVGSIKDLEKQFNETMSLIEKELEKQ
jgi:type I restriction enzyme M protein